MRDLSRFLSLVLRHNPDKVNIKLDENGWVSVESLIHNLNRVGYSTNLSELKDIVNSNDKKRFEFNESETNIRASQGHSVKVDLGYKPEVPPMNLFHGTILSDLDSIYKTGLMKMKRHSVHLSHDLDTAFAVGSRRSGTTVMLGVESRRMHDDGYLFYKSTNGVWLTDRVPSKYIYLHNI